MYLTRSEYDRGVNTFSPEGRIFQIEYANEAIKLGSTAIGIKCPQGIVLAVEKRIPSPLLIPSSIEKIFEIDAHIGAAVSGLVADARTLIDHARVASQHHTFLYNEQIRTESLTQSLCDLALRFGEGAHGEERIMARPFGVALLVAGWDAESGPQLFHTDPSGTFTRYEATAIGAGCEAANCQILEEFRKDMSLDEAKRLAMRVLKTVMEEKLTAENVEFSLVTKDGYSALNLDEINGLMQQLL